MKDGFSIFRESLLVLQSLSFLDKPIDIVITGFDADSTALSLDIGKKTDETDYKYHCSEFSKLPTEFCGSPKEVITSLLEYLRRLESKFGYVGIFNQFHQFLTDLFCTPPGLTEAIRAVFDFVKALGISCSFEDVKVTLCINYPAYLRISINQEVFCYYFDKRELRFQSTYDIAHTELDNFPWEHDLVPERTVYERVEFHKHSDSIVLVEQADLKTTTIPLTEDYNYATITLDEIHDKALQILTILDLLDSIQNVVIDEGAIYYCFDPIISRNDIDMIVTRFTGVFPNVSLILTPENNEANWWVIEVSPVSPGAYKVSMSGAAMNQVDPQAVAKAAINPVIDQVIKGLDVNKALSSAIS